MAAFRLRSPAVLVLSLLSGAAAHAAGETVPVRSTTPGAVWSTSPDAFRHFVQEGTIADRGLGQLIARSGWTPDELRAGFAKTYAVSLDAVAHFLNSEAGVIWLRNQTRSYAPFATLKSRAPQALRAAILADANDGEISAAGIMASLPTHFRLAKGFSGMNGVQNVCAVARCEDESQCTSLLSWFYFLPACIQANSTVGKVDQAMQSLPNR